MIYKTPELVSKQGSCIGLVTGGASGGGGGSSQQWSGSGSPVYQLGSLQKCVNTKPQVNCKDKKKERNENNS